MKKYDIIRKNRIKEKFGFRKSEKRFDDSCKKTLNKKSCKIFSVYEKIAQRQKRFVKSDIFILKMCRLLTK